MVINDVHIPFEDKKSLSLCLDIFKECRLHRLIINGDLLDCYNVNAYGPKHPDIITTLEDELIAGLDFFTKLRKRFPKQEIIYIFGNHENRLNRFILNNAKPFWNIVTIEKYLQLDELNIQYLEYNQRYQIEKTKCFVQHSPPSYGVAGSRTSLLKKLDQTHIWGCTHREQKSCVTASSGEVYSGFFNGWLGSFDATIEHKRVFGYANGHQDWQQSFCIVTVENGKEYHVNQYSIRNHKVVVDGFLFEA